MGTPSYLFLSLRDLRTWGDTWHTTAALLWGPSGGSVGTAKDDHVLREAGQVAALFLILLVLAFLGLGPQLHPRVLPDDVADAGRGGRQDGSGAGPRAGWAGVTLGRQRAGTHWGFSPHRSEDTPHIR